MTIFPAYAGAFEVYPTFGRAFEHLSPVFRRLNRVVFTLRVHDPFANQGQMVSDFDRALEKSLLNVGAKPLALSLPPGVPQEMDFAFTYGERTVAVEIEKTNREKILRDLLKCHMYLHAGADFAVIGLPKNYPHSHGIWDLFTFGVERLKECTTYSFGTPELLGRILLLGFEQRESATDRLLSKMPREEMRTQAIAALKQN